jgi:UDP-N-acetylmuramoyl-tripeptide--D-alanyl-D-alanine ligase
MSLIWILDAGLWFLLVFALGYYVESCMQWYAYSLSRVALHFNRPLWHLLFFAAPVAGYYAFGLLGLPWLVWALCVLYPLALATWMRGLDKPLAFTPRVKRFFGFLLFSALFCGVVEGYVVGRLGVIAPLLLALLASWAHEKILFSGFIKDARRRLDEMSGMRIVTITASYGKTSIKNFLYHILGAKYECYKTPRSVNTLAGLVMDINTKLPKSTEIYITEAGARERGDIREIAELLRPDVAIVGQIGAQHIEYFKSLEAIRDTKMELISSPKLARAFVHTSARANPNGDGRITIWGDEITFVEATLDGTRFGLMIDGAEEVFETKLLGAFNAANLAVCVLAALYLGMRSELIKAQIKSLPSVEHRLQRIDAGGKIILDDSFNGNFEGMSASYELARTHQGRKVLITPGIVESTAADNAALAAKADEIFELIIITGTTNLAVWDETIQRAQKVILRDKSQLTDTLAKLTKSGDLILFSNDAPTYM